jgi:hypothetical protein
MDICGNMGYNRDRLEVREYRLVRGSEERKLGILSRLIAYVMEGFENGIVQ